MHAKQRFKDQNYKSLWVPDPTCGFSMPNSDFWTRITRLYGSQTCPVDLCMQNIVISTRITCLYGSQPSSVVFACKTATSGPELQVSMSTTSYQSFCACKTACRITCLYGSQPSPVVFGFKTTRITSVYGSQISPIFLNPLNIAINT